MLPTDHIAVIEYRGTPDQITATCHQYIHRAILHIVHISHYPYITDTSDRSRDPTIPLGPQAHCQERDFDWNLGIETSHLILSLSTLLSPCQHRYVAFFYYPIPQRDARVVSRCRPCETHKRVCPTRVGEYVRSASIN